MTVQPTRDQLRALADAATPGPWRVDGSLFGRGRAEPDFGQTWGLRWRQDIEFICAARTAIPQLLDQLDRAEHRIARLEAQAGIRGRAVVMYRERARDAETRIRDLTQEVKDERGAALDLIEQVKIRDARIKAVQDALSYADMGETLVTRSRIRRALDN